MSDMRDAIANVIQTGYDGFGKTDHEYELGLSDRILALPAPGWVVKTREDVCEQWPHNFPRCTGDDSGVCMSYVLDKNVCKGKDNTRPATVSEVLAGKAVRS